jgi:hypothetical protein
MRANRDFVIRSQAFNNIEPSEFLLRVIVRKRQAHIAWLIIGVPKHKSYNFPIAFIIILVYQIEMRRTIKDVGQLVFAVTFRVWPRKP